MTQKRMLNLGCGRIILPAPRPAHYGLLDPITDYPLWLNVDRNAEPGVDEVVNVFEFPYPWKDNTFDGALLAHIAEHCPHEINTGVAQPGSLIYERYHAMQDAWYCMFSELHRVCTAGSIIHVLSPYAWSQGAVTDPTHTRYLTEHSFTHSMQPDPNSPFKYATGGLNLQMVEPARFAVTELFAHLLPLGSDAPDVAAVKDAQLQRALQTQINVAYELYVKLRVVK